MRLPALAATLIALVVGLCGVGCGRKGPPAVPRTALAAEAQELRYQARDDVLELSWHYPAAARQPEAFRVLRARLDAGCPDCPPRFQEVGRLRWQAAGVYLFRDAGLSPGAAYAYVVVPLLGRGVEGPPSEALELTWRAAEPPVGLVAAAIEGGVRLFWEPQPGAAAYAVYRAEGAGEFLRLGEAKVPPYVDLAAEPGRTYRYVVATIAREGEGPPSAAVEITVREP